jgi:hypothetical protein
MCGSKTDATGQRRRRKFQSDPISFVAADLHLRRWPAGNDGGWAQTSIQGVCHCSIFQELLWYQ